MTHSRPFTTLAAILFGLAALVHLYRQGLRKGDLCLT